MIQDLSGSWCIKGTDESKTRVNSPVPLMHHDPDRSWITDPDDPDDPKGTYPMKNSSTKEYDLESANLYYKTIHYTVVNKYCIVKDQTQV